MTLRLCFRMPVVRCLLIAISMSLALDFLVLSLVFEDGWILALALALTMLGSLLVAWSLLGWFSGLETPCSFNEQRRLELRVNKHSDN